MKVALDWTPNVMHIGLYIAKEKRWLDVDFVSPAIDDYTVSPSVKVMSGMVDFCISSPEIIINHHLKYIHPQLHIVAPVLQSNTSAFVALKENAIQSVADWSGKTYASLGMPLENDLVHSLMRNAGIEGHMHVTNPLKLDTWALLLSGEVDLTWTFLPVGGAEAEYKDIELQVFKPEDYGIPYPQCPYICTSRNLAEAAPDVVNYFRHAAERGYKYAIDYPEEAVECLRKHSDTNWIADMRMLLHQQHTINAHFLNRQGEWGRVNDMQLQTYINWLYKEQIISRKLDVSQLLYTVAVEEEAILELGE